MKKSQHNRSNDFGAAARLLLSAALCSTVLADPINVSLFGSLTSSTVNGVSVGAGTYSDQQLSSVGSAVGMATAGGFTGVPLWSLLGGNAPGTRSDVMTDSGKNAILRFFVLATNSGGSQFVISLGEVDPFFGGGSATAPFVSFAGGSNNPALVFPNQSAAARDVANLVSLQVLSVPAAPVGPGGPSTSFSLSGNVGSPGNYTASDLKTVPAVNGTINGDLYTGVSLWSFLGANTSNEFNQYVLATGSDGYQALFSLAELDPSLGAPNDLISYADTGGQFPSNGFARIVIPGDNHAGRYVSNLLALEMIAVPEPSTISLLCLTCAVGVVFRAIDKERETILRSDSISTQGTQANARLS